MMTIKPDSDSDIEVYTFVHFRGGKSLDISGNTSIFQYLL